jgi:hypothetical protein
MNASQIFTAAHKTAKAVRKSFLTYRAAFSQALREIYAGLRKIVIENKKEERIEVKPVESNSKCAFQRWLELMIDEKGVGLDSEIQIDGHFGVTYGMLTDFLGQASKYQKQIKETLIHIDYKNGDIFHYLQHLATGMVEPC